jgi:hypothetical protein
MFHRRVASPLCFACQKLLPAGPGGRRVYRCAPCVRCHARGRAELSARRGGVRGEMHLGGWCSRRPQLHSPRGRQCPPAEVVSMHMTSASSAADADGKAASISCRRLGTCVAAGPAACRASASADVDMVLTEVNRLGTSIACDARSARATTAPRAGAQWLLGQSNSATAAVAQAAARADSGCDTSTKGRNALQQPGTEAAVARRAQRAESATLMGTACVRIKM